MRTLPPLLLGLLLAITTMLHAEETITVGGAVVIVPAGWSQTAEDGRVVLAPPDLPQGVACTFTLLGGEPFKGSLKERLDTEWKDVARLGRVVSDDGGKINDGGPVITAGRAGQIEMRQGVIANVWLLIISANGRIERMVFVTTTPESFANYGQDVSRMINSAKWIAPPPGRPPQAARLSGNFGRMTYSIPPGWRETRSDREVVLSPRDAPPGESLEFVIMRPKPVTGTLAAALALAWNEAAQRSHLDTTRTVYNSAYDAREQKTSFRGWPYIRASGTMTSAAEKKDYFVNLTVIKINNRLERIVVRSTQNTREFTRYSLYDSPAHYLAVQELIFGLRFDDWKEPRLETGNVRGGGIVGVWRGIAMFGGRLKAAYVIFFSNGQVFFGSRFPLRGCHELSTWNDAEEVPAYWGTYRYQGDKGSLTMVYGEVPIRAKGSDLILTPNRTDHTFVRLASVDGVRINGTYAFPETNGKNPSIRFTADGHFEDHGALNVLRLEGNFPFSPTSQPGGGTYAVKDYTLLLDYTDGRKYRLAFPGGVDYHPENPSPDRLPIGYGDQELKRQ